MYMYVCCHLKGQGKNGNYMKPPNISTKSRSLWQSELPMLTNVGGQHTVDQLHICVGPMPLGAARDAKKMTSEIDMKQKDEELLSLVYVPSGSMILYNMIISLVLQCSDHMTTSDSYILLSILGHSLCDGLVQQMLQILRSASSRCIPSGASLP